MAAMLRMRASAKPAAARAQRVRSARKALVASPFVTAPRFSSVVVRSAATDEIIEKMKSLTLLEAAELVTQIEETFGVDASAPVGGGMMMAAPGAGGGEEAAEEKTEFDLIIEDVAADKRIAAIKVVRGLTSLGLKDAKDAVTNLPFTVLEGKSKEECEAAVKDLEEAGAKCKIA
mmetsp:Transcript_6635/g.23448  ORF Transcript_6635/g.23448 Transcript_6635/m.23448 type:complete len:175 (-) Transcript_6635:158-682(-)